MIESVKLHDKHPDVLEVRTEGGFMMWYHLKDGNLYPGRVWQYATDKHTVSFFLPIPDGMPTVLRVVSHVEGQHCDGCGNDDGPTFCEGV